MDRNLKLSVTEEINVPASRLWNALTDTDTIRQFMWGTEAKSEWKAGSALTFEGVWQGKPYREKGTILEIEKEKLMKYSYLSNGLEDRPENYAIITYRLLPENGKTRLTVTQEGARDEKALEHSQEGWKSMLGSLKKIVEG